MTTKTIHDLADEFNISVRKLSALAKAGHLTVGAGKRKAPAQMRYYLNKGQMMTAEHLLMLIRDPELIDSLEGSAPKAKRQIASLGKVAGEDLGTGFSYSLIYGAYIADPTSLETLAAWARRIIPATGCGYHYIAVRMLFGVSEKQFKEAYSYIGRAIVNLRKWPGMAPYIGENDKTGMRFCQAPLDL